MNWKRRSLYLILSILAGTLIISLIGIFYVDSQSISLAGFRSLIQSSSSDTESDQSATTQNPEAGPYTATKWNSIRNSGGLSFVNLRRNGIDHLVIYAGRSAAGTDELSGTDLTLLEGGFDIITHRPTATNQNDNDAENNESGTGGENQKAGPGVLDDDALHEFLELATSRPGYRKRILILHGRQLRAGLEFLAGSPRSVATVVVLRPGDAIQDRAAIVSAALLLPDQIRILWIPSNYGREPVNANGLRNSLTRANVPPAIVQLRLSGLSQPGRAADFHLQLTETLYYELLQERLDLVWQKAPEVFSGGCGYFPNGARGIYIETAQVSGGQDSDFCPLFVRRPGRPLYHAEAIAENRCTYRVADGRTRLYCAYD